MFYNEDDYTDNSIDRIIHLFDLNELVEKVSASVSNYYDLDNGDQLDIYDQLKQNDIRCIVSTDPTNTSPCPVQMDISYISSNTIF